MEVCSVSCVSLTLLGNFREVAFVILSIVLDGKSSFFFFPVKARNLQPQTP